MKSYRTHLMLCAGTGCVSNGSYRIKAALERELAKQNLQLSLIHISEPTRPY
mgnify:CR=1 FL=1